MKKKDEAVLEKSMTIVWTDDITIENIQEKKDELLKAFENSEEVKLDCSKVSDIDITAIQLVIASYKESLKLNKKFSLKDPIPENIFLFIKNICGSQRKSLSAAELSADIISKIAGEADA